MSEPLFTDEDLEQFKKPNIWRMMYMQVLCDDARKLGFMSGGTEVAEKGRACLDEAERRFALAPPSIDEMMEDYVGVQEILAEQAHSIYVRELESVELDVVRKLLTLMLKLRRGTTTLAEEGLTDDPERNDQG